MGLSDEEAARLGTGGDVGVGRTDTIMLLHIPTVGEARLVPLPRDSYVTIPGYGDDKINAAFTYGGPQLLTATVENATGLRIDHYAEIGMGGLANVVDAIGGVELCPAEPINDPLANLDIQAGCQKMDGATSPGTCAPAPPRWGISTVSTASASSSPRSWMRPLPPTPCSTRWSSSRW